VLVNGKKGSNCLWLTDDGKENKANEKQPIFPVFVIFIEAKNITT
jgi:hypothetical protein